MDRRHYRALIGLLALTAWLYHPLWAAPFVFEDAKALQAAVVWELPGRGLTQWAWSLTPSPDVAHAVNVALHLVNGALVCAVASQLVTPLVAVSAAGVFLLHPLNSEAVAYVTGRGDLLVTLFTLLAVWAALGWVDRGGRWRAGLGLLALVGAALSKEIGLIALPLVVLTLAAWRPSLRPTAGLVAVLCGLGGLAIGAAGHRLASWTVLLNGTPALEWSGFAALQLTAIWHLLALAVWPVGFSIDHDIVGLGPLWTIAAGLLTVLSVALVIRAWRRAPVVAWGLCWIAMCVAPRFVFADVEVITEYKLATAMVGVSALLGSALAALVPESAPAWRERIA